MSPDLDADSREPAYDVFLSYSAVHRREVEKVARALEARELSPWFDRWALTAGCDWRQEIENGLRSCAAGAIFIGPGDSGPWQQEEVSVLLDRAAKDRRFRLFPVLLPGLEPFDPADLPPFLATRTWVDLRAGPTSDRGLRDLKNAVLGIPSGSGALRSGDDQCPYRGLEVFDEEHAAFFFGRQGYVQRLVEKLKSSRFLAVVGPSGTGKSSLVRAGLIPRLRAGGLVGSDEWLIIVFRPGASCAAALAGPLGSLRGAGDLQSTVDRMATDERTLHLVAAAVLADKPSDARLLVVVDQSEELFTLGSDAAERTGFLANLQYAATIPGGRTTVILTLRADFYAQLTEFAGVAQLAQSHQVLVGGLRDDELREIIEEPAHVVGMDIEPGLVETVLEDVVREPGTLPLLEHAMLETWRRRHANTLTLAGYRESGGVQRGLAERAEALYADLDAGAQQVARQVLLRLTQPGEGTEDTRRRIDLREVTTRPDRDVVDSVVRRFVAERLMTTSVDDVTGETWLEVSHEALFGAWPRLRGWLDADRKGLLVHRDVRFAAQQWERLDRDEGALLRGGGLAEALGWRDVSHPVLNALETEFLDRSREVDQAARTAERRRRRVLTTAMAVALVVISAAALFALDRGREAAHQRDVAVSRQLASSARTALTVDPVVSVVLAGRALDTASTTEAEEMLRQSIQDSRGRAVLRGSGGPVRSVRFLADGTSAVSGSDDGTLQVWDLRANAVVAAYHAHRGAVFAVRPSPDGTSMASAGNDGAVALTDRASGMSRVLLQAPPDVYVASVEFSKDGRALVAATSDGAVRVVSVTTGAELAAVDSGDQPVYGASFSPDGLQVVAAQADGTAVVRSAATMATQLVLRGHEGPILTAYYRPDGRTIATAGADGTVGLWNAATGVRESVLRVSPQPVYSAVFNHDGDELAIAGQDGLVHVWAVAGVELFALRGHVHYVQDADFSPAGNQIVSAGEDETVRTWDTTGEIAAGAPLTAASFGPGGERVVAGGGDGHTRVWAAARLGRMLDIADHTGRSWANFSADGKRIVSYGEDRTITIRDARDGRELARLRQGSTPIRVAIFDPAGMRVVSGDDGGAVVIHSLVDGSTTTLSGHVGGVYSVAVSPDGGSVLSGGADGTVRLWKGDGAGRIVGRVEGAISDVVFSPDGKLVAAACADGTVRVWEASGRQVALFRGHQGTANAIRFGPDSARLASAGEDGTVRVWDVPSTRLLVTFPLYRGGASAVDIGPDGTTILSSSENDQIVRVVTCEVCGGLEDVRGMSRSRALRALTPDEEQRFVS